MDTFELALQSRMDDLEYSMNNISEMLQNNLDTVDNKLDETFNKMKYDVGVCLLRKIGLCNPNREHILAKFSILPPTVVTTNTSDKVSIPTPKVHPTNPSPKVTDLPSDKVSIPTPKVHPTNPSPKLLISLLLLKFPLGEK